LEVSGQLEVPVALSQQKDPPVVNFFIHLLQQDALDGAWSWALVSSCNM